MVDVCLEVRIIGSHLMANDFCRQELTESPILLDDSEPIVQNHNFLIQADSPHERDCNLLYFSIGHTDGFFEFHETLPFRCPKCRKTYEISREDYLRLRRASDSPSSE
jgi:hypothetical protein